MMKRYIGMAMALLACNAAFAAPLTPGEALARLQGNSIMKKAPAKEVTPLYTVGQTADSPAVYVFSTGSDGFMMVAADDQLPALLGYSDSGAFDSNNIPDGLKWWFGVCEATLKAPAKESANYDFEPIAPLMSTLWNQLWPYYNMCPEINGQRCATGCVATAMAQVMKYHRWPERGTGSNTYTFEYKGQQYSASADFSTSVYDWDNMKDDYRNGATLAQANAVAQLMYDCGVAVNMNYGPDGSGAKDLNAVKALAENFGYSKGIHNLYRDWFDADSWAELIYNELSEGRPVIYCGVDNTNAGHAFVCDGYLSDGLFHINWGWSGTDNGYFLLSDLNPYNQGVGGGSGQSGFNYKQTATIGIEPAKSDEAVVPIIYSCDPYETDTDSYGRSGDMQVAGGFYSNTYCKQTFNFRFLFTSPDGTKKAVNSSNANLNPWRGFDYLSVPLAQVPEGYSTLKVQFRTPITEWQQVYYPADSPNGVLLFATNNKVLASLGGEVMGVQFPYCEENGLNSNVPATLYCRYPTVDVNLRAFKTDWNDSMAVVVARGNDLSAIATGDYQDIALKDMGEQQTIECNVPTEGLERNVLYAMMVYSKTKGQVSPPYYFYFIDDPTGVDALEDEGAAEYFTVDGVKTDGNARGLLIKRRGAKAEKILKK